MNQRVLLFSSIGLIMAALIIGFIALNNNKDETGLDSVSVDANTNEVVDLEQVEVDLTPEERAAAEEHDRQRLADVQAIQEALESFKKDNDAYPEAIEDLVPKYLAEIPENPSPGGQPYSYTPIGTAPYAFYDIGYALEVGVDEVTIGTHTANPEGIAEP